MDTLEIMKEQAEELIGLADLAYIYSKNTKDRLEKERPWDKESIKTWDEYMTQAMKWHYEFQWLTNPETRPIKD